MDRRSITSKENGKKGGRKIGEATLKAQMARDFLAKEVAANLSDIVAKAIEQAKEGDYKAREWLSGYAWGKPAINLGVTEDGQPVQVNVIAYGANNDGSNDSA